MPAWQETWYTESTYSVTGTFTEAGVAYDLTGATVTLLMRRPDGTEVSFAAEVSSPATAGIAVAEIDTDDLDQEGVWGRAWRVVKGGDDRRGGPTKFLVTVSP
jgi:hypothetical protein